MSFRHCLVKTPMSSTQISLRDSYYMSNLQYRIVNIDCNNQFLQLQSCSSYLIYKLHLKYSKN